jgi:nucleoside-diphosphate-sugar epimerase
MHPLITDGADFIGSNLAAQLIRWAQAEVAS